MTEQNLPTEKQEAPTLSSFITDENFQKINLLSGKEIGIRGWKMKEEKDFLFVVETQMDNKNLLIDECLKLARRCVDDLKLFDNLSRNDLVFLLSQLRKISKGAEIDFAFRCVNNKCPDWVEFNEEEKEKSGLEGRGETPYDEIINLETHLTTKEFDSKPIKIGNFKFYPKEIPFHIQRKLESDFLEKKEEKGKEGEEKKTPAIQLNKFNYNFVLNSINIIEIENNQIEEFSNEELMKFIDNLSPNDFLKLSDKLGDRIGEFSINKKAVCPSCKNESDIIYEEMFSLMVF